MLKINDTFMAKVRFNSIEEAISYVNTLPIQEIIHNYARLLFESQDSRYEPIRITEAQFREMFRIIGTTRTGEVERRGRRPKEA